jgi:uncharacterized repeat protein (TIGR04138 family)
MQKIGFSEALDAIVTDDPRYDREAYMFVRDALDYTIKQRRKSKEEPPRHVRGPELLEGFREFVLKQFGPMGLTVLDYWGVRKGEDVGHIVFNLISAGVFGKTEQDSVEDFKGGYDFHEAFVAPFRPEPAESNAPGGVPVKPAQ